MAEHRAFAAATHFEASSQTRALPGSGAVMKTL